MTGYKWNSDQAAVYDLQGVIVHVGNSFKEGHYYAVVRDGDDWWEFDDEKVTRVSITYTWSCHAFSMALSKHPWLTRCSLHHLVHFVSCNAHSFGISVDKPCEAAKALYSLHADQS